MTHQDRKPKQLSLDLTSPPTWGGRRAKSGRKKKGVVPHARRPSHSKSYPVHVTLRLAPHVWSLRSQRGFERFERALRETNRRGLVRVAHFSVQLGHIHMIVESTDRPSLAGGIKGFEVRLARLVNAMMGRRGRLFGDRYHARALRSPREVRNALVYVINNRIHHAPDRAGAGFVDAYSSGPFFDGWSTFVRSRSACTGTGPPVSNPRTWLLETGWRRRGLIAVGEAPAS